MQTGYFCAIHTEFTNILSHIGPLRAGDRAAYSGRRRPAPSRFHGGPRRVPGHALPGRDRRGQERGGEGRAGEGRGGEERQERAEEERQTQLHLSCTADVTVS